MNFTGTITLSNGVTDPTPILPATGIPNKAKIVPLPGVLPFTDKRPNRLALALIAPTTETAQVDVLIPVEVGSRPGREPTIGWVALALAITITGGQLTYLANEPRGAVGPIYIRQTGTDVLTADRQLAVGLAEG